MKAGSRWLSSHLQISPCACFPAKLWPIAEQSSKHRRIKEIGWKCPLGAWGVWPGKEHTPDRTTLVMVDFRRLWGVHSSLLRTSAEIGLFCWDKEATSQLWSVILWAHLCTLQSLQGCLVAALNRSQESTAPSRAAPSWSADNKALTLKLRGHEDVYVLECKCGEESWKREQVCLGCFPWLCLIVSRSCHMHTEQVIVFLP